MPIVDCKIEIPDDKKLAEPFPRPAKYHEIIWAPGWEKPDLWLCKEESRTPYFILAEAWQWPPWLLAEWIVMDSDGRWWMDEKEPRLSERGWLSCGHILRLCDSFLSFTPPPCTDWKTSKRRNPRCTK